MFVVEAYIVGEKVERAVVGECLRYGNRRCCGFIVGSRCWRSLLSLWFLEDVVLCDEVACAGVEGAGEEGAHYEVG